jgi:hypothetical protein
LKDYEMLVQTEFENNLNLRTDIYRNEKRWENAPFWSRRHAASDKLPNGWPERKTTLSPGKKTEIERA